MDAESRIDELERRASAAETSLDAQYGVLQNLSTRLARLESARGQAGEVEPEERVTFYSPSSSRPKLGEVCEHGHLKRQCELCSLAAERDRLAVKLSEAQDESAEHLRAVVQEIGHRDKARAERDAAILDLGERDNEIYKLSNVMLASHGGPLAGETACGMAARLLKELTQERDAALRKVEESAKLRGACAALVSAMKVYDGSSTAKDMNDHLWRLVPICREIVALVGEEAKT